MKRLMESLREFVRERDWEQFHSPKNLSMALAVECSEVMEIFQWMTTGESSSLGEEKLASVKEEIGDCMIYLTCLADKFDIDPIEAAFEKIEKNRIKYPAHLVSGKAKKYNEY